MQLNHLRPNRRLRAISLFTGAGGLDYGFESAGFETAVALDLDAMACETLRLNRPWPVIQGDVARIPSKTILETAGLDQGSPDVLIGGPPCQPFSKSGYWANGDAGRLSDPRANTLRAYLRVLEDTLPRTFLLENVPGLAFSGKSDGLDLIQFGVSTINERCGTNYNLSIRSLNAANFGVPQLRQRVFVIGDREGREFTFPEPTHGTNDGPLGSRAAYRNAWDALGDLGEPNDDTTLQLSGKWADLIATIPEGSNYLWHTERGGGVPLFGWRTRYWNFLLKLAKDLPSWTLQAQPGPATGPFHWNNRRLSIREMQRLQTFPDDVLIPYGRSDAQRLIGNAVPSALAEVLAASLAEQFLDQRPVQATLVPPCRGAPPPPQALPPVPLKYRHLIGQHAAHPGTGKGTRASARRMELAF